MKLEKIKEQLIKIFGVVEIEHKGVYKYIVNGKYYFYLYRDNKIDLYDFNNNYILTIEHNGLLANERSEE